MRYITPFVMAAAAAMLPSVAMAADTCALVPRADATTLLGQPAGPGMATGPERDEDSSGQLSYCMYRAGTSAVLVSLVEFSSPAEAKKALTQNLIKRRMDEDDAKVTEEPGIGERSFYAISAEGSMYVFLKGNKVVGLGVGGVDTKTSAAVKASLKSMTAALAGKV